MMRLTLLGLCLSATVTASSLKPEGVVPIDEDPGMYPVEDGLVEYVPNSYMAPYEERPRYEKEVLYYPEEEKYPEYKRYGEAYVKHEVGDEEEDMEPPPRPPPEGPPPARGDKPPAIRIYVV